MAYCPKCGKEVVDDAEICIHCGCRIKNESFLTIDDEKNLIRFLLTFFLGFIGSFIINNTNLKRDGWKSRTSTYLLLGIVTLGIYNLVASISNFTFNPNQSSNIGYIKD